MEFHIKNFFGSLSMLFCLRADVVICLMKVVLVEQKTKKSASRFSLQQNVSVSTPLINDIWYVPKLLPSHKKSSWHNITWKQIKQTAKKYILIVFG